MDLHIHRINAAARQALNHRLLIIPIDAEVVRDLLHARVPVAVRHEHAAARRVGAPPLAPRDVPRIADHELEVVVAVDGGGDVPVVLGKLFPCDDAVLVDRVPLVQELGERLVGRQLPLEHPWVLLHTVHVPQILHGHLPVARLVEDVEGLVDEGEAARVHVPTDAPEELVEADGAALVAVKIRHNHLHFPRGQVHAVVA